MDRGKHARESEDSPMAVAMRQAGVIPGVERLADECRAATENARDFEAAKASLLSALADDPVLLLALIGDSMDYLVAMRLRPFWSARRRRNGGQPPHDAQNRDAAKGRPGQPPRGIQIDHARPTDSCFDRPPSPGQAPHDAHNETAGPTAGQRAAAVNAAAAGANAILRRHVFPNGKTWSDCTAADLAAIRDGAVRRIADNETRIETDRLHLALANWSLTELGRMDISAGAMTCAELPPDQVEAAYALATKGDANDRA